MAATNPYDLGENKGKGGPARPVQAATLTEAEQLEKLHGYVVVPKDLWPFVKYSTHVRYIETAEKGGEFRGGGFVLNNPFDTKVRGSTTEKRFIKLQNGFNKGARDHKEWIAAYEDIEFLYVKGTGVELTLQRDLQTAVTALNANISRLAEYCKKSERRIAELEGR
jgi:hypothetical protein